MTIAMGIKVHTIYASFSEAKLAEQAAGALLDHGVLAEDISIVTVGVEDPYLKSISNFTSEGAPVPYNGMEPEIMMDPVPSVEFMNESATKPVTAKTAISTTTPGDVAVGAVHGAEVGLGVGAVAALASLIIPGFGIVIGAGALATAIAGAVGATAAGAVAGGMYGYLRDQGVPIELAERYSLAYRSGDTILAVTTPSNGVVEAMAYDIINKYHGNHLNSD